MKCLTLSFCTFFVFFLMFFYCFVLFFFLWFFFWEGLLLLLFFNFLGFLWSNETLFVIAYNIFCACWFALLRFQTRISQDYPQITSIKSMVKTVRMILNCKIFTIYYNTMYIMLFIVINNNYNMIKYASNSITLVHSLIYPAWVNTLIYTSPGSQFLQLKINTILQTLMFMFISGAVVLEKKKIF